MQYQISSDNIQMSESMIALTKEKFSKIESRLKHIPAEEQFARVVINSAPENTFEVKANVTFRKKEYFSDESDFTLETALIKVVNELTRMMEKDKEKWEQWEQKNREIKRYGDIVEVDGKEEGTPDILESPVVSEIPDDE
jgi:ribosomal subunit interface protein